MCNEITTTTRFNNWTPAYKVTMVAEEDGFEYTGPFSNTIVIPAIMKAKYESIRAHGGSKGHLPVGCMVQQIMFGEEVDEQTNVG